MRIAVADIGSNSTRLLLADVDGASNAISEVARRSTVTRLGAGVEQSGELSAEAIDRVLAALTDYDGVIAAAGGADARVAVLTSAVRDASNGPAFTARVTDEHGYDAQTIPGELEARLSFLGATSAREPGDGQLVVVDIGGGSTEFIVGTAEQIAFHVSTQVGVVRHTERHIAHDPPTGDELATLATDARATFAEAIPAALRASVNQMIAVEIGRAHV